MKVSPRYEEEDEMEGDVEEPTVTETPEGEEKTTTEKQSG